MKKGNVDKVELIKITLGEIVGLIDNKKWRRKNFWPEKLELLKDFGSQHDTMIVDPNITQETVNHFQLAFEEFYNLLPTAHKDEAIKRLAQHKYVESIYDEYENVLDSQPRSPIFSFLLEEKFKKLSTRPTVESVSEIGNIIKAVHIYNKLLNDREKEILEVGDVEGKDIVLDKIRVSKLDKACIDAIQRSYYTIAFDKLNKAMRLNKI